MNTHRHNELGRLILRRNIALCITVFSLLLLFACGGWTWLMRDGIDPDYPIKSSGVEALSRFMSDFWPIGTICTVLFILAFFLVRGQSLARIPASHEDEET